MTIRTDLSFASLLAWSALTRVSAVIVLLAALWLAIGWAVVLP